MQVLWAAWGKCKAWALLAGGVLLALIGVYAVGRRDAGAAAKVDALKADAKTHERINDADIGIGASDADNMRWLRDFHERHRN